MTDQAPADVAELIERLGAGERFEFLPFWGHHAGPAGGVGPWVLSQWWPAPFTVDGVRYPTAEHYMMAGKARLFDDTAAVAAVLSAPSPAAAKAAGRAVAGFDEQRWARRRFDLVVDGNVAKFGSDPDLAAYLLGTGDRVLVEASPVDRVWGIGLAAPDPAIGRPDRWRGENLLGFALMRARRRLAGQSLDNLP